MRLCLAIAATLLAATLTIPAASSAHTLTYRDARKAAQAKADQFAGQRTRLNGLLRLSPHRFIAQANWDYVDPDGCKGCVYNEETGEIEDGPTTVYCFAGLVVRYRTHTARKPTVKIDSHYCT